MYEYTSRFVRILFGAAWALFMTGCGPESTPANDVIETPHLGPQHAGKALQSLLAGQQQKLLASDGAANDSFGYSIAFSGDTAIVGAIRGNGPNGDQGSVYVFVRDGTQWTEQAKLIVDEGAPDDLFGARVSLSGDTALIGAFGREVSGRVDQGAAYVFVRNGFKWTQQAKLLASDGSASDHFGESVAVFGDVALVGAPRDDFVGSNLGSVYVFTRNGDSWTQQTKLVASDGGAGDLFGSAVSMSGDTAIVGAYLDNIGTKNEQGSAYVFVRDGNSWTEQAKLVASDGAAGDEFGAKVSLSGDTALISASRDDSGAKSDQGSGYIFVRNGVSWSQEAKLVAPDGAGNDKFGNSVSISGDAALIGAAQRDIGANVDQGSAYLFTRENGLWTHQVTLTAKDGVASDEFGRWVSLSGNTAILGASVVGPNQGQGSAYVFIIGQTCATVPNETPCDDSNPCTQTDACQNGACAGTSAIVCPTPDLCQQSICNPATGLCISLPLSDQTPCPGGVCKSGGCYVDNALVTTGSGGSGGMGGAPSSSGNASNGSTGGSAMGNSNGAPEARDIAFRGSGCHCNIVASTSHRRFAWPLVLAGLLLARCRRRERGRI